MIRTGQIRSVPRGMANRVDKDDEPDAHDSHEEIEQARMARERINQHTICLICGGAGHGGVRD